MLAGFRGAGFDGGADGFTSSPLALNSGRHVLPLLAPPVDLNGPLPASARGVHGARGELTLRLGGGTAPTPCYEELLAELARAATDNGDMYSAAAARASSASSSS